MDALAAQLLSWKEKQAAAMESPAEADDSPTSIFKRATTGPLFVSHQSSQVLQVVHTELPPIQNAVKEGLALCHI